MSANYVGNHGIHEVLINQGLNAYDPSGFTGLPLAAPDSRFSNVTELQTDGISNYNGLTLSARHNFSNSFQATASYTYSHALSDVSDNGFTAWSYNTDPSIVYPQNPYDPRANYGNNDTDVRHALTASYVWTPPLDSWIGHGSKALLAGWSVSGTFFYRTGLPFTVIDSADTAVLANYNYGAATLFANYLGGAQPNCSSPTSSCLNAGDFSPAASAFGDQARNQFRGPGFFNTDLSVMKSVRARLWGEGQQFVVGASFYNILNHPNFDQPVGDIANPQFGQIVQAVSPPTSILGSGLGGDSSPRQIQLTAKIIF